MICQQCIKNDPQRIWYRKPASCWTEALPLGSGRLGAMVFGDPKHEKIALNEETLWSGYPKDTNIHGAAAALDEVRRLANEGQYQESQRLIEQTMLGPFTQCYLPLGDLLLDFDLQGPADDYQRSLTFNTGVAETVFTANGVTFRRELFASHPGEAVVIRLTASRAAAISFTMTAACQLRFGVSTRKGKLILSGVAPSEALPSYVSAPDAVRYEEEPDKKGMRFQAIFGVFPSGGTMTETPDAVTVKNADEVLILCCMRTSFNGYDRQPFTEGRDEAALCESDLSNAGKKGYDRLFAEHLSDFSVLYDRVRLSLGTSEGKDALPTDERLMRFMEDPDDNGLIGLLFHYGRYLLISSSRPGGQPANLQGVWNPHLRAPWSSNYTLNINAEMNYWPAEVTALPETHLPFFDMIDELAQNGKMTAREHYGARGTTAHHNTDLWRLSQPVGNHGRFAAGYAFWPMGFGWLTAHLFEHYQFTGDKDFLRRRALPALREAARFYLDLLTPGEDGSLRISPTISPENAFLVNGKRCAVAKGSTMTDTITREVFENYLSALKLIGDISDEDREMQKQTQAALLCLSPFRVGRDGRLLEWDAEYEEAEKTHRHVSHLYALYPGHQISPDRQPELLEACKNSLAARGDDGTGWSLGWKVCLWARLMDGDHALRLIQRQLHCVREDTEINYSNGGGTYPNLMDAHPPFQIDGNFGVCAGIAEMLLQSSEDYIRVLPALPESWPDGEFTGLRARGGLEISARWAAHRIRYLRIRRIAGFRTSVTVAWNGRSDTVSPAIGEEIVLTED